MAKKPRLHQVLAVDKDLAKKAKMILDETVQVLKSKHEHFFGYRKTLEMFDDDRKKEETSMAESREITTTVPCWLKYTADFMVRLLDCLAQKEATNQHANADVIMPDGTVLLKNVPATMLLVLERELPKVRAAFSEAPTHTPGVKWIEDSDLGEDIFRAEKPETSQKTEKDLRFVSIAKATKEHKEQVETFTETKVVGQYTKEHYTSTISPRRKADILSRLDEVIKAVKKARAVANDTEVVEGCEVGASIFDFVLK